MTNEMRKLMEAVTVLYEGTDMNGVIETFTASGRDEPKLTSRQVFKTKAQNVYDWVMEYHTDHLYLTQQEAYREINNTGFFNGADGALYREEDNGDYIEQVRYSIEPAQDVDSETNIEEQDVDHYMDMEPSQFNPNGKPVSKVYSYQEFQKSLPANTKGIDSTKSSKTQGNVSVAYGRHIADGAAFITGVYYHMSGYGEVLAEEKSMKNKSMREMMESASMMDGEAMYDGHLEVIDEYLYHLHQAYLAKKMSKEQVAEYERLREVSAHIKGPQDWRMAERVAEELRELAHDVDVLGEDMEDVTFANQSHVVDLRGLDSGQVYDLSQTRRDIKDGSVLLTDDGPVIMYQAWPINVFPVDNELHNLKKGSSWETIDGGKYKDSYDTALFHANKTEGLED